MNSQKSDKEKAREVALPKEQTNPHNKTIMQALDWQSGNSESSMTTERGGSKGGDLMRGDKKPNHTFSKRQSKPDLFAMDRFMKESQGPRGSAPWVHITMSKTSGGGQKKK